MSAHSAGYEEVARVWLFNPTDKLDPDISELLSMHCSWCVLDCGEAQINTDLAPIYSSAIPDSKKEGTLRTRCRHRPVQYLNNILEQDHRAIKRRVNAKQGFREFQAARRTIQGYEAIHMIRKGQARWVAGDDLLRQIQFIDNLFELAA